MVAGPTNPSLSKLAGSNPTRHHFASANGWRYQAFAHLARPWLACEPRVNTSSTWKHWRFWPFLGSNEFLEAEKLVVNHSERSFFLVENNPPAQEVITMATYRKSPNIGGWMLGCVYPRRTSSDSSCHWLSNFVQHSSEFHGDSTG